MIKLQEIKGNCSLCIIKGNDSYIDYSFSEIKKELQREIDIYSLPERNYIMIFSNYYVRKIDIFSKKSFKKYSKSLRKLGFKKIGSYKKIRNVSILIAPVSKIIDC